MSWGVFKSTLIPAMQTFAYGNDMSAFSKALTNSYDLAIKSGGDIVNGIPLINGNKQLMETTLTSLLLQTQMSKTLTLLDVVGPAIIAYWAGAKLSLFPSPLVPAVGSIKNISTTTAIVLSPGNWTSIPTIPNNNVNIFLDTFIQSATLHLMTVSGIFSVVAQYPPPAPPAPGIVMWSGYKV